MAEYKIKFEVFEGPLDLLLYLIKKEEVDIYEVNLTQLATQFIEYIDLMRMLDLELAGEFLVMASTLMYIKSRELLPVEQQVQTEGEDDGEDPRWELIRQLVEYKKFKDAAAQLSKREDEQANIFTRQSPDAGIEADNDVPLAEVSIFDLINAFNEVLKKASAREDFHEILEERFTVSDKIEEILYTLRDRSEMIFSELFANAGSRAEVVVTFLALLELIRMKRLKVLQAEAFGEIRVIKAA